MGDNYQNGATYYTSGAQQVYAGSPPAAGYAYAAGGQQVVTRTVPAGYATTGYAPGYSAAPMPSVGYVQQAAPQVVQTRAVAAPAQQIVQTRAVGAVASGPPVAPDDLPAGATYVGMSQRPDGTIIDRYALTERQTIPVRSVVPEVQEYEVTGQTTVPETKHIQVEKMVPVMETVMVPKQEVRTVMVPEQRQKMVPQMETQAITVERVVPTKQTMQRTVEKVIEGSKYVDQERILEYERPRPRLLQHGIVNKREAGVEFTAQVGYTGGESNVRAVSQARQVGPGQVTRQIPGAVVQAAPQQFVATRGISPAPMVASVPPTQYVQGGTQYVQRVAAPSRGIYESPGGYMGVGGYQTSPTRYGTNYQSNQIPPQYSTQPGNNEWAGYSADEKEGAF